MIARLRNFYARWRDKWTRGYVLALKLNRYSRAQRDAAICKMLRAAGDAIDWSDES